MCYEVDIEIDWPDGFFISTVVNCTVTNCLYVYVRMFCLRNCQNSLMLCATCAFSVYSVFISNELSFVTDCAACTCWQCPVGADWCGMSCVDQVTVKSSLLRVYINSFLCKLWYIWLQVAAAGAIVNDVCTFIYNLWCSFSLSFISIPFISSFTVNAGER